MRPVERALRDLGLDIGFPPTPDFAVALQVRPERARSRRRRSLTALACTVVVAVTAVALAPGARTAIVGVLAAIPGIRIERAVELPRVPVADAAFGERTIALDDAIVRAGYRVRLPASLGRPDRVSFSALPPFLAGNTLIWSSGGIAYRLEADVSLPAALRIAASLRTPGE